MENEYKKKTVLFVNVGKEITSRTTWSGITYSIYNELKNKYEVLTYSIKSKSLFSLARIAFSKYFLNSVYLDTHTVSFAKSASKQLEEYLSTHKVDLIFSIGCAQIAYIKTDIPIIYFSDAVVSSMEDYYFRLTNRMSKTANLIQKKALEKATKVIITSDWAKRAVINDYGIATDKVEVIHFGSNTEVTEFEHICHEGINLLFVGKNWERKGGDIAIDMMNELDRNNIK